MKEFKITKSLFPFLIRTLDEKKIKYTARTDGIECIVKADVSNRRMKSLKRIAWGKQESEKYSLPVLTREDLKEGTLRTGLIPKEEAYFFEKARL